MPVRVSEYIGVDRGAFAATGAFDAILDADSLFFIDPHLLRYTAVPELRGSYGRLELRFRSVLKVLAHSRRTGDAFWREAERLFDFPEVPGLCMGYSRTGTRGSGMGKRLKQAVLGTAKEIIDAGIVDPEIFELMGVLEEGVGSDRISDMVAGIVSEDIATYAQNVFRQFGVSTVEARYAGQQFDLPINLYNGAPILLVPRDILARLPVATSWEDIDAVSSANRALRNVVNRIIGSTWRGIARNRRRKRPTKREFRDLLVGHPGLFQELIEVYRDTNATPYDFASDPAGEVAWVDLAEEAAERYPLELRLPQQPSTDDIVSVVEAICAKFKDLIENHGHSAFLYADTGAPKPERATQLLFYGVADAYCQANNLDLSPETNAGRGPVDFKMSKGYGSRVLVETKLSTNTRLVHGFETQVGEYSKAEHAQHSFFVVVHVRKGSMAQVRRVRQRYMDAVSAGRPTPELVVIDGLPKASASRYGS